jgi:hypothetical protein
MGREVKRVALDFNWPVGKTWGGYLNPFYSHCAQCSACNGSGLNPATKQLDDDWYDFSETGRRWCDALTQDEVDALVAENRLRRWNGETREWESVPRTAAEVNGANGRGASMLGDMHHDAINRWICVETRAKRLGVYGKCAVCGGEGDIWSSPEKKKQAEDWKQEEPPSGEGWQMWETTSEGSPISPVFDSPEKLARWLAETGASSFGSMTATYDQWLDMCRAGWAPSAMAVAGNFMSGVEAIGEKKP